MESLSELACPLGRKLKMGMSPSISNPPLLFVDLGPKKGAQGALTPGYCLPCQMASCSDTRLSWGAGLCGLHSAVLPGTTQSPEHLVQLQTQRTRGHLALFGAGGGPGEW